MKRKIKVSLGNGKFEERVISYIPGRYIAAFMITIFEVLAIIGVMLESVLKAKQFMNLQNCF